MPNKRIIDLEDSNQLDLNDFIALYQGESVADNLTYKRRIGDVLALRTIWVNGKTGSTINLNADDISDTVTAKKFVSASEKTKISFIRNDLGPNIFLAGDGSYRSLSPIGGASGTTQVVVVASNYQVATDSNLIIVGDTTVSGITVYLPSAPVDRQTIKIKSAGNAHVNTITVHAMGISIEDVLDAYVDTKYGCLEVMYIDSLSRWIILSFVI